jgi:HEAT repeat-containing protein 5
MDTQTAKIAANCVRSLLLQPSPTPADLSVARYLLPRLIGFVTTTEPEDPENARRLIAHTLTQYVASVASDHTQIVMAVVAPALLSRASSEGTEAYRETSARLLEMASIDQNAFRGVVAAMSEGQKAFMEEVIKSGRAIADGGKDVANNTGQPSIALKMDFGA